VKTLRIVAIIAFGVLNWVRSCLAGTLTLEWDPSPDPDVAGYRLYYGGLSQQYTNLIEVGPATLAVVDNLLDGATYYFAVTSVNAAGLESDYSGEVAYLMLSTPCAIAVSQLNQVYDGYPKSVSISAGSGNLGVVVTYAGSVFPPINAGTYQVTAVSTDPTCLASATELLTISKAPATVQINNVDQIYDGAAKTVSTITTPPGLPVAVTYNGLPDPPTQAGTYQVSASIIDPNYSGSATSALVIEQANAGILLEALDQTYNGAPKQVWTMTIPPGLALFLTYNGVLDWPVNAGSYTVNATVQDPNYFGSRTVTLVVHKAQLPILLSNLSQVYDGTPKAASVSTTVPNIPILSTYNGKPDLPVSAGTYFVDSTIFAADNYTGEATGTLSIAKAPGKILLSNLSQAYDGTPKSVSVTTLPAGLKVLVFYNNKPDAPSAPGTYSIMASIDDTNFQGATLSSLQILLGSSPAQTPAQADKPDVNPDTGPATAPTNAFLLSWSASIHRVRLWQSMDLASWTPFTNLIGASNSFVIHVGPKPLFLRATAVGPDGENPLPLSISKP
jgi:hypothetical protein